MKSIHHKRIVDTQVGSVRYALAYAAIGLPVFPLKPGRKDPATRNGFRDATTNTDQIRKWWSTNPSAGIGVYPYGGGWAVLDIDTKKGGQGPEQLEALQAQYGLLPPTLTASTPSGATHLVFKCDVPLGNHKIAPDIDIRSGNGYIAVEPTVLADGSRYRWHDWEITAAAQPNIAELPHWVIELSQQAIVQTEGKTTGCASPNPPPVHHVDRYELDRRLTTFLQGNQSAANRWSGSTKGLNDSSGSAMDFSMIALLKTGGFNQLESRILMQSWTHGSSNPNRNSERYWKRIWENTSDPHTADDAVLISEFSLAEQFIVESKNRLRWTHGLNWMLNSGTYWKRDDDRVRYTYAKAACRRVAAQIPAKNSSIKRKIQSAGTVHAIINLAQPELEVVTPIESWDADPMILNTTGGAYDLRTGKKADIGSGLFTQVTSVAPDQSMSTPTWDQFMQQIFDSDMEMIEFVQRMSGYILTGCILEQKLFFMHGAGANGKSVFIDALREIAGTYGHNFPSEGLVRQRNERHPTVFASLFGKRLAVSSEIEESAYWAESRIKELTGNSTMTAHYMRQDFFEFKITHKHLVAGNYRPQLRGNDYAMARRIILIPFEQTFTGNCRDQNLPDKLRAEYPGVLAWAIEGARKWFESGLQIPSKITAASHDYMTENDDIARWIVESCNVAPQLEGKSSVLYASFKHWCESLGERALSNKLFSQMLEQKYPKRRTKTGMVYAGLDVAKVHR